MILCLMPEASNVYSERNSNVPFDPAGVEQETEGILCYKRFIPSGLMFIDSAGILRL